MGPYKQRLTLALLGATLGSLMLGCTAHKQPSRVETALANMAKDVVIPMEAEDKKDPLPDSQEVLNQGREIFLQSCAICHGADGRGETYVGRNMYPPAMDMNSPHVQHWSDAELFWIIQNGVRLTGMPSWESSLSQTDTWKLVRFVHNLPRLNAAPPAPLEAQHAAQQADAALIKYGKTLYRQEGCFTCHRLNGEGGSVGPDLTTEGSRGRSTEWLVGHFKDPPAYVHGSVMPPFKNLTEEQLRALTGFLQNQKGRSK
ncbi:MAG: c-type cytochrome [Terriglobia bacterium]|jgi:mono/diheme cytochrome c family protein